MKKRLYIKRTFIRDGDWYILKYHIENNYKVIYIHGNFTLKIGDGIENPKPMKTMWKHEKLTLEQVRLEVI
jgi:hypothetical protein